MSVRAAITILWAGIIVLCLGIESEPLLGQARTVTISDENGVFLVSVPSSWDVQKSTDAHYSEVILTSTRPYDIRIVITSRPLDGRERALPELDLINRMLNASTSQLESQGYTLVNIGKAPPLIRDAPTFVVTSHTADAEEVVTSWGTATDRRNFSITTFTKNSESSVSLADQVRRVVESFRATDGG